MLKGLLQLSAGAVLAVAGLASADDPIDGEAIARARCTGCHNLEKLDRLASRIAEAQRAAKLERFLPSHNLPKADERAAVIAWLLALAKPASLPAKTPPAAPDPGTMPEGAAPPSEPGTGGGADTR